MSFKGFDLAGKTVVVVGGTSGLGYCQWSGRGGRGCGGKLAALGTGGRCRRGDRSLGRKSLQLTSNVSRRASLQTLCDETLKAFGKVDILVNSAGKIKRAPTLDCPEDAWADIMNTNVTGHTARVPDRPPEGAPRNAAYVPTSCPIRPDTRGTLSANIWLAGQSAPYKDQQTARCSVRVRGVCWSGFSSSSGRRIILLLRGDKFIALGKLRGKACTIGQGQSSGRSPRELIERRRDYTDRDIPFWGDIAVVIVFNCGEGRRRLRSAQRPAIRDIGSG